MAVDVSPDCRDDNHGKCQGYGWDLEFDAMDTCPCTCHPDTPKCGQLHELPGLAYLGKCLAGANHAGPHQFNGPLDGTVISVTVSAPEGDPGAAKVLEDLGRAMGKAKAGEDPDMYEYAW
jgi:hypothetical protein